MNQVTQHSFEVIVADDHSNDDSVSMVENMFPSVIINQNDNSELGVYTLASNWNGAAQKAKGKRLIFSNADMIFSTNFVEAHLDPVMQKGIIFGPGYLTYPPTHKLVTPPLDGKKDFRCRNVKELYQQLQENRLIGPDRHAEKSADTYNQEWEWDKPFGYNFSVLK